MIYLALLNFRCCLRHLQSHACACAVGLGNVCNSADWLVQVSGTVSQKCWAYQACAASVQGYTLRARCTNVVHDLGSAEPRSKVEPSSCWITLHQVELWSADPVQLNGRGYTIDDSDWSTNLGLLANYNDVTVTRNAYETIQYRLAVICSNFKLPWRFFASTVALIKFRRYAFCVPIDICYVHCQDICLP